jgi:hypothetical protein
MSLIVVTTAGLEEGHGPIYDLIEAYMVPAVERP